MLRVTGMSNLRMVIILYLEECHNLKQEVELYCSNESKPEITGLPFPNDIHHTVTFLLSERKKSI